MVMGGFFVGEGDLGLLVIQQYMYLFFGFFLGGVQKDRHGLYLFRCQGSPVSGEENSPYG